MLLELLIKLLTDCDAWITNGEYRLFEQRGEYHIGQRQNNGGYKVIYSFGDLVIALSKYTEMVEGE